MAEQIPMMDTHLSVTDLTPEQVRGASLVLAGHAAGAGELAEWLECCGLRSYPPSPERLWTGRPRQARPSKRGES